MAKKKLASSIPRTWLIWEWLLDWNWLDTNDWTKNNGITTNVTYVSTERWYQKQAGSFNGDSSYMSVWHNYQLNISDEITINYTKKYDSSQTTYAIDIYKWYDVSWITRINYSAIMNASWVFFVIYNWSWRSFSSVWFTPENWKIYNITLTHKWWTMSKSSIKINWINYQISWDISAYSFITNSDPLWIWAIVWYSPISAVAVKWLIQSVRIYNRVLSQNEIQNLYQEWLRQLWAWSDNILSSAVAYYDFNWDANDIIGWYNWTVSWATLTTDRFWITNRAYSFGVGTTYISTPNWTANFWTWDFTISIIWSVNTSWTDNVLWSNLTSSSPTWISIDRQFSNNVSFETWSWGSASVLISVNTYTSLVNKHITVTRVWTTHSIYIDWVLEVQSTLTVRNVTNAVGWAFWRYTYNNTKNLNWKVETWIFIPRWLSSEEVKELYNLSKTRYLYPLKKTFPLNLRDWLVLELNWDSSWTTYYDNSGNGNNWTWTAVTNTRIGQHKIMWFNWSTSRIQVPHSSLFNFTNKFTINLTINQNVLEEWKWILWKWQYQPDASWTNQFVLLSKSTWKIEFIVVTSAQTWFQSVQALSTGKNYRVSLKYDWAFMYIYINWALDNTFVKTWNIPLTWTLQQLVFWDCSYNILDQKFNWNISNIKVYNRDLSHNEIQEDYFSNKII